MSAASRGMRGGQPSTTHPIPAPWLSPKVVTRKRWPKLLCDMGVDKGAPFAASNEPLQPTRRTGPNVHSQFIFKGASSPRANLDESNDSLWRKKPHVQEVRRIRPQR